MRELLRRTMKAIYRELKELAHIITDAYKPGAPTIYDHPFDYQK